MKKYDNEIFHAFNLANATYVEVKGYEQACIKVKEPVITVVHLKDQLVLNKKNLYLETPPTTLFVLLRAAFKELFI